MINLFGPSAITGAAQSTVAHAASGTGSSSSSSDPTSGMSSLTSESTFLQLLIAQIKNQDPLNPTDSIQFVGQLVQYSELEQLMNINKGVTDLANGNSPSGSTSGTQANNNSTSTNKTSGS